MAAEGFIVNSDAGVSPTAVSQCDTFECAEFIVETEHKRPSIAQREELVCALRDICIGRVGCQMGSADLEPLLESMPGDAVFEDYYADQTRRIL